MNAAPGTVEISYSVHSKTEDGQISLTWMAFINPLEDAIAYAQSRPGYVIVKTTREVLSPEPEGLSFEALMNAPMVPRVAIDAIIESATESQKRIANLQCGDRVQAKYKGGKFGGVVIGINADGEYAGITIGPDNIHGFPTDYVRIPREDIICVIDDWEHPMTRQDRSQPRKENLDEQARQVD